MKKLFLLLLTVMLTSLCAIAQNVKVSGTVVSADDGEPLAGATVHAEGTNVGVSTDINGQFTLSVPASVKKLRVAYVGFQSVDVDVAPVLNIALKPITKLDEVMVVAYGTAKKSEYTGSASVVKSEDLENAMVTNAVNAMTGKIAGVQILNSTGQPGTSPTVRIRGVGSINASSAPLYVLDGMPFDGDVASINTMDIESMTVLKDAAAAALYGARGANGVILITTKKGRTGDARVTLDARWGSNSRQISGYDIIESPAATYEMAYAAIYNGNRKLYGGSLTDEAARARALQMLHHPTTESSAFGPGYNIWTVPEGQDLIGTNGKLNPNATLGYSDGKNFFTPDNWVDESYLKGLRQEYNISITGGNDRLNYYVSGGYLKDEGIIANSDYERLATRASVDYQAKKWLKIGTNLAYNYVRSHYPDEQTTSNSGTNVFNVANNIAPVYPMYIRNADGSLMMDEATGNPVYDYGDGVYSAGVRNFYNKSNAVSELIYGKREYLNDILNGKWYATLTPVENLNITGTVGYYLNNRRIHELASNRYGQMKEYGGFAEQQQYRYRGLNLQALATYRHSIADKHNLDYLLGYESYDYNSEVLAAWGYNLYQPDGWTVNNTLNNDRRKGSGYTNTLATRGIFGRINYNYDGKYYFSFSYRRDASSRFAPENRWGNFFSVSGAWDIAKESFMQEFENVDLLKFKASFGQQGNDGILDPAGYQNYYAYTDQWDLSGTESWSDGTLSVKGNRDITWEKSNNFNIGFDFSFFQGRIDGTVEYFQRQTSDMLYNKPTPPSLGYSSMPMNVGSMRNYGTELELTVRPIDTKDLTWEVSVNGTWIRNKVLKLAPDVNGEIISGNSLLQEGKSQYQYYLVQYAGVNNGEIKDDQGNVIKEKLGAPMYWALKDKLDADGKKIPMVDKNGNPVYETYYNGEYKLDAKGEKIQKYEKEEYLTTNYDAANQTNRKATGNTLPSFYGGFGTTLQYKGFDFAIDFAYQLGGKTIDYGYGTLMHSGGSSDLGNAWHKDMANAWTPENTDTRFPKLNTLENYTLGGNYSDFLLTSSNYLSLNNITVGYTLPESVTSKIGINQIRVYAAGDNIAIWTKRKGLDPRFGYGSFYSNRRYSAVRNISGGIRVTF